MCKFLLAATVFSLAATAGTAATLQVQGNVALSGILASNGLPSGGNDQQTISTNSAPSGGAGSVAAAVNGVAGNGTAFASANLSTGQVKSSVGGNAGIYYTNVPSQVIGQELGAYSSALISDTFTAVGSGTVRFDLAYDGSWDLSAQQWVSCCDFVANPATGIVSGVFAPTWNAYGSLVLGGNGGLLAGDSFAFSSVADPLTGAASGVLSIFATLIDGFTYGISASMDLGMFAASGYVDFANTATLSYSTSPGLSLLFGDPLFLSTDPDAPAPVPVPAGILMLASGLAGLGVWRRKAR